MCVGVCVSVVVGVVVGVCVSVCVGVVVGVGAGAGVVCVGVRVRCRHSTSCGQPLAIATSNPALSSASTIPNQ